MIKYNEITDVHLEITSNCQASCPMCMRNFHGGMSNPNLKLRDMSIDEFKKIFSISFVNQLKQIYLCGNYGDPIINNHLIKMVKYIKDSNKTIKFSIHTNGSARTTEWWKKLATELPDNHMVNFALDGIGDTHHLYRIGTNYNKIIDNATAFINAGGKATWVFIKFKHNQHQVDQARQLAKEYGFCEFHEKETSRFISKSEFDVYDKDGNITHKLEMPDSPRLTFISDEAVRRYKEIFNDPYEINCKAIRDKEIYIDASSTVWPCCFLSGLQMAYTPNTEAHHEIRKLQLTQLNVLIELIGGLDNMNGLKRSVKDIIDDSRWQSVWHDEWYVRKNFTCIKTCSVQKKFNISRTFDQTMTRDELNGR